MSKESTLNYRFRYKVQSHKDLEPEVFHRRLEKAQRTHAASIFIDLTESIEPLLDYDFQLFYKISLPITYYVRPIEADFIRNLQETSKYSNQTFNIALQVNTVSEYKSAAILTNELIAKSINFFWLSSPIFKEDFSWLNMVYSQTNHIDWFWSLKPYNKETKNGLTLKDISDCKINLKVCPGLEIQNTEIPENYELISLNQKTYEIKTPLAQPIVSIIIPSFNNVSFLSNVLEHLFHQDLSRDQYEVIVIEDGGTDDTIPLLYSFWKNQSCNLKLVYWPKENKIRGPQNFFRAGLARNLGAHFAISEKLVFLDSDMLVPPNFISKCLADLDKADIVQFKRYHLHQNISLNRPSYSDIDITKETYIEEKSYWSQLFNATDWMNLKDYWKYTCTYGLALKKHLFWQDGGFKKYYVSYGFEDTDLGYRLYKQNKKFLISDLVLYHLTHYDSLQYKNSQWKRLKLLRKTAALFYLQYLDHNIYHCLGNFYKFEKPVLRSMKDYFSAKSKSDHPEIFS